MKNWVKNIVRGLIILIIFTVAGIYSYNRWYIPYRHAQIVVNNLKKGFVIVNTFNCPKSHPIKARLGSMIYHLPYDPYYNRTSALNGYCFDTASHAKLQGFRNSYNR